jgi:hypothetical protein
MAAALLERGYNNISTLVNDRDPRFIVLAVKQVPEITHREEPWSTLN